MKKNNKTCFLVMGAPFSGKGTFIKAQLSSISNKIRIHDGMRHKILVKIIKTVKENQIVVEFEGQKSK